METTNVNLRGEKENLNDEVFLCKTCGAINQINRSKKIKSCSLNVPSGLEELLLNFTINLLRKNPNDLEKFALEYFISLNKKRVLEKYDAISSDSNNLSAENETEETPANSGQPVENILGLSFSMCQLEEKENFIKKFEKLKMSEDSDQNKTESDEKEEKDEEEILEDSVKNARKNVCKERRFSVFNKSFDPEDCDEPVVFENDHSETALNGSQNDCAKDIASDFNDDFEIVNNRIYENQLQTKTKEQFEMLRSTLCSIVIFRHLYGEDLDKIIDSMFERKCSTNEVIIRQGLNGNYFYVILNGAYEIYKKNAAPPHFTNNNDCHELLLKEHGTKVAEYSDSGFFGELSLLYNQPRSATIVSKAGGVLYCMNREKFQRLVIGSAFKRRKMYEDFLYSVPVLNQSMNDYEICQVADALNSRQYLHGECIFKQNDEANGMYFIEAGEVEIIQEAKGLESIEQSIQLRRLFKGEYFGELALVNKSPRTASAYAHNDTQTTNAACKLAFLDLNAFERLMGPCIDLLKSKIVTYKNY